MSSEEFFMYLTIGLIVAVPLGIRLYRYMTIARMKRNLHQEFMRSGHADMSAQHKG